MKDKNEHLRQEYSRPRSYNIENTENISSKMKNTGVASTWQMPDTSKNINEADFNRA